jgi:DUF1680 family protein
MKNTVIFPILFVMLFSCNNVQKKTISKDDVYDIVRAQDQYFQPLMFGEVKPTGWLKAQMQKDLDGFIGNLDQLVPDLMSDSIYGKHRLTKEVKSKNVGNIGQPLDPQYLWWNSETQSNWRDGYIRNAILLNDQKHLEKVEKYMQYILATQDSDGYMGIYAKDLRYHFTEENGELWSKATLLRGLLAYYEYTKGEKVIDAIKKTVANVMENYPIDQSSPFKSTKSFVGGVTHGLVFTDILDRLFQLTGDTTYSKYALFLYKDFSNNVLAEDAQYNKLMDSTYKLKEHGAHTYEHLRPLTVAYYTSGSPKLKKALDFFLKRIQDCTTSTGGAIGDEWIAQRTADATETGYEYCSLQELMDGYRNLLQKTGDASFGDKIETTFFNAAQGARHPYKSSITYCKTDNSYEMTGTKNGEPAGKEKQTRFKYSPAHQDVAVCCVPNAGRISTYFVNSLWMKEKDGLVATLFAPCEVKTQLNGNEIKILEETNYPFENIIQFKIKSSKSANFSLKIRKPIWAKEVKLNCDYKTEGQYLVVNKTWQNEESITLELKAEVEIKQLTNGQKYFTYSALVFALPFESEEIMTKKFAVEGFADYQYKRKNNEAYKFVNECKTEILHIAEKAPKTVWETVEIKTELLNTKTNKKEQVKLFPVGATILRQVTFEN